MKAVQKYTVSTVVATMPVVLGGRTDMSPQDRNTGVGTAVVGIIGHEIDD
jgi:hypothetical protein